MENATKSEKIVVHRYTDNVPHFMCSLFYYTSFRASFLQYALSVRGGALLPSHTLPLQITLYKHAATTRTRARNARTYAKLPLRARGHFSVYAHASIR